MTDEAVAWLREQVTWSLDYARKNAARRPVNPMRSHEMRDLIADCEAHLALLDEHGDEHMCFSNSHDGNTWDWWIGDCRVMTTLASAYRHREGYDRYWGEMVTHAITEAGQ